MKKCSSKGKHLIVWESDLAEKVVKSEKIRLRALGAGRRAAGTQGRTAPWVGTLSEGWRLGVRWHFTQREREWASEGASDALGCHPPQLLVNNSVSLLHVGEGCCSPIICGNARGLCDADDSRCFPPCCLETRKWWISHAKSVKKKTKESRDKKNLKSSAMIYSHSAANNFADWHHAHGGWYRGGLLELWPHKQPTTVEHSVELRGRQRLSFVFCFFIFHSSIQPEGDADRQRAEKLAFAFKLPGLLCSPRPAAAIWPSEKDNLNLLPPWFWIMVHYVLCIMSNKRRKCHADPWIHRLTKKVNESYKMRAPGGD